jgi:hypothetical protein
VLGAGHAPVAVLARDQAAVAIDRVPVRVARGVAEYGDVAGRLVEAQHAVVRDVRPDKRAVRRKVGRTLRPAAAVIEVIEAGGAFHTGFEALVERLEDAHRSSGKTSAANSSI